MDKVRPDLRLTPHQAQIYRYLYETLCLEPGETVPTVAEIGADLDIHPISVSTVLSSLENVGILSRQMGGHGTCWAYSMILPHASYEVCATERKHYDNPPPCSGIAINQEAWTPY